MKERRKTRTIASNEEHGIARMIVMLFSAYPQELKFQH
jgi:hypothetical protein